MASYTAQIIAENVGGYENEGIIPIDTLCMGS